MNRQPTNGFKKGHKKIEGSGRQPGQTELLDPGHEGSAVGGRYARGLHP